MEILAPAGNAACAIAAINSGADAIYLGFSAFSARQGAENFELEGLREIVKRARFCGVKVYVAMNTIVKDGETEAFHRTLLRVWKEGVDAIILQDALLGKALKKAYPEIVLHLSTQAGVCSENGARFAKECGFSRVILARETPFAEIVKITKIVETEAFVQGALCSSFSGQCFFSSFAGGNSGNRGRCKQPCRKLYSYNRKGFEEKAYALSPSDLSVGEDIVKYIQAGVVSFKIEGRMRREEYVAAAVRYYKALLDAASEKTKAAALSDLKRAYNRGNYTKGLAFGQDKRFLSTAVQGHIGEKVGVVKVVNGKYLVESAFVPQSGDAFKILREGKEIGGAVFLKKEGKRFVLSSKNRLKNGDSVFVTTDTAARERVLSGERRGSVALRLYFHENDYARVEGTGASVCSQEPLQSANSRPLTKEELIACFSKTDGLPVDVAFEEIDLQGNIFIPKSQLNALRRSFFEALTEKLVGEREEWEYVPLRQAAPKGRNGKIAVIASDFDGVATDIAIYKPNDYAAPLHKAFAEGSFERYLYYPAYCTSAEEAQLTERLKDCAIDGVYAENYGGLVFAREHGLKVFVGIGLHIVNRIALGELLERADISYYAVSKELNESELAPLIGERAFALGAGDIKVMELCYCPFGKRCKACDQADIYELTDENGRVFPVRRYRGADGNCRFEVYNCARLVCGGVEGAGALLDLTTLKNKEEIVAAKNDTEKQKKIFGNYTSGHYKRGVL
ncbi:MAG: U32 family peptidase [Clostridia bacterium]|nr:U32 family peptidase [Clostridia bacterium]